MMNDYWHIPRASLSSAASSSAASLASSSNRSNRSSNSNPVKANLMVKNYNGVTNNNNNNNNKHYTIKHCPPLIHQKKYEKSLKLNNTNEKGGGKRNSSSSQGSSKSNNSTTSAASGSLLLTAANLERFAEIHKKQEKATQKQLQKQSERYLNKMKHHHHHHLQNNQQQLQIQPYTVSSPSLSLPGRNYNSNLVHALENSHINNDNSISKIMEIACITSTPSCKEQDHHNNEDTIINIDPNLDFIKTKNLDNISIASSMHFTMVNGESGSTKKAKRGLCDRGRQVTVLIISMSTIFMFLIMGMVYALEMRARDMPQS